MPKVTNPTLTEPVWLKLRQADFLEAIRTLKPKGPLAPVPDRPANRAGLTKEIHTVGMGRNLRRDGLTRGSSLPIR